MNLDSRENIPLKNPDALYGYINAKIIDDFESVLNGLLHYRNVDIYVTGSNAKFLSLYNHVFRFFVVYHDFSVQR